VTSCCAPAAVLQTKAIAAIVNVERVIAACSYHFVVAVWRAKEVESSDYKIAEDDFGVAWGGSRWISHATEKSKTLKEEQEIEAELAHRHEASGS
jgi:hypothetical protein